MREDSRSMRTYLMSKRVSETLRPSEGTSRFLSVERLLFSEAVSFSCDTHPHSQTALGWLGAASETACHRTVRAMGEAARAAKPYVRAPAMASPLVPGR